MAVFRSCNLIAHKCREVISLSTPSFIFGMADKENIERHLAVRDYLRKHVEVAKRYGALKKRLAQKFPLDIEGYCEGKDAFVKAMEIDALRWKVLISESRK